MDPASVVMHSHSLGDVLKTLALVAIIIFWPLLKK